MKIKKFLFPFLSFLILSIIFLSCGNNSTGNNNSTSNYPNIVFKPGSTYYYSNDTISQNGTYKPTTWLTKDSILAYSSNYQGKGCYPVSDTTKLPTKYRAGVMYQVNKKLMVELDWLRGENDLPGNSTNNYVAAGTEYYYLDFLPLRAGFSVGGYEGWKIALGAGIKYKEIVIDMGVDGINNIIANKRLSLAFSVKIIL